MSKVISLRISEELLAEIDKWAALGGRSRNWLVNMIFVNWVGQSTAAKEYMLGISKNREEHVPGFLAAGLLAAEEFDRREEEAFIARLPDVGGTPRLPRLGKSGREEHYADAREKLEKFLAKRNIDMGAGLGKGEVPDGPHILTARDGTTAFCDPQTCKFCAQGTPSNRGGKADKLDDFVNSSIDAMDEKQLAQFSKDRKALMRAARMTTDTDGELTAHGLAEFAEKHNPTVTGVPDSNTSPAPGLNVDCISCWEKHPDRTPFNRPFIVCPTCGNKRCPKATSHELACTGSNEAGQKGSAYEKIAAETQQAVEENYKPKTIGELRERMKAALEESAVDASALTKEQVDAPDFGVAMPGSKIADMAELRNICAGNIVRVAPDFDAPMKLVDQEVDLCGFETYNEVDGENYICGLEKHGSKVKHGAWIKI